MSKNEFNKVFSINKKDDVLQAVELCRTMWENEEQSVLVPDYTDTNISTKVVKIIQCYMKIINKAIWGKE